MTTKRTNPLFEKLRRRELYRLRVVAQAVNNWDTHYGAVRWWKSDNTEYATYFIEFYNAGWSENESLQWDMQARTNDVFTIVDKHPLLLLEIKWASVFCNDLKRYAKLRDACVLNAKKTPNKKNYHVRLTI